MLLYRAFNPLTKLALFIASRSWTLAIMRLALKPFKMRTDRPVSLGEDTLYVNSIDRLAAAFLWKLSLKAGLEARIYRDCVKPGMTVLEIGANIGFFTLLFSRLSGKAGKVIAFEPDPGNFRLLEKNIKANDRGNVLCVRKAVSDKTGPERLFRSEEHHGDHRTFDSADGRESVEIEAVAIDGFLPAGSSVDFIKMDIQGAEYSALLGMEGTIRNSARLVMLCEFSPALIRRAGASPEAMLNKLAGYGFSLKYLDEGTHSIQSASQGELLALCPGEKYLNLLLEKNTGRKG